MKSSLAKACLSSPPSQPLCIKLARAVTAHLSLLLDEASGNAGPVKESEATSSIETFHITLRAAFQSTLNASLKMWDAVKVYDVEDSLVKQARRSLMAIFVVLTRIMKDTPECFEGEEEQVRVPPPEAGGHARRNSRRDALHVLLLLLLRRRRRRRRRLLTRFRRGSTCPSCPPWRPLFATWVGARARG